MPRFVSLRTDQVNFRAGPGFQYPVTWIYQRDGLPVEIIGEFDVWRQVLAPDGGTGWVHEATIRARRSFYITAPPGGAARQPGSAMPAIGRVSEPGGQRPLLRCDAARISARSSTGHVTGYLARADFWGAFAGEAVK